MHPKPRLGPGVQAVATENSKPRTRLPTSVRENILGLEVNRKPTGGS